MSIILATPTGGNNSTGDMEKSVYDTDDNGVVDNSESLEGNDSAYHLDRANHAGTQSAGTITGLAAVATSGDYNDLSNQPDLSVYDEVEQHDDLASFPGIGNSSKFYLAQDTGIMYRWNGASYVVISGQLALGETSSTAYRGDRGKTAYDHSLLTSGNPHNVSKADVGLSNVPNTDATDRANHTGTQTMSTISDAGTSATLDVGTTANKVVQLDGAAKLPAVDGSQLTNLPGGVEVNDLTASVTWANVPDANITQSSVTQHQGALSITESQISDLGSYQPLDSHLTSLAGLVPGVEGRMITSDGIGNYQISTTSAVRGYLNVADGATANDTDANLKDRANHTGTQTASTISDFDTEVSNNASVAANTAKISYTDAAKVAGIEAGADVTDATNVDAAGAVMNTDTTTASMSFVIDEDDMTSDSATKVPTQQSVKAYVDASSGGGDKYAHTDTITTGSGTKTITHNLGVTQADVEDGKYHVIVRGDDGSSNGRAGGHSSGHGNFWGGYNTGNTNCYPHVRHRWGTTNPGDRYTVYWQANTLKVNMGASNTGATILIEILS